MCSNKERKSRGEEIIGRNSGGRTLYFLEKGEELTDEEFCLQNTF
jgi:hypothetical protein